MCILDFVYPTSVRYHSIYWTDSRKADSKSYIMKGV